ncbi:hypothetical protein [Chromobacterium sphagni]|uniref:hypothetical protein n=1 Tax=Chromobacterium sphagni TaxID=1903179 RepID=UPI00111449F2|nr:hypothetical protein [Chromobacterium sphagni]
MAHKLKLNRINCNNSLEILPVNPWSFEVDLGEQPEVSIERLLEIVREVSIRNSEEWPSDDDWRAILPVWLKTAIPELSKEETDRLLEKTPKEKWDSLPWEFLSWLDALRDRGWEWWGYKMIENSAATIVLHIARVPERIDSFRELLRACGIEILSESYMDF